MKKLIKNQKYITILAAIGLNFILSRLKVWNVFVGVVINPSLMEQLFRYTTLGFELLQYGFLFTLILVFCTDLKIFLLLWNFRFIYYRQFFYNYFIFMNRMDKLFYSSFTRKILFSFILCSVGVIIYNFIPSLFFYWRLLCIMFTVLMIIHKCNYKLLPSIISLIIYSLTMLIFQCLTSYLIKNVDNIVILLEKSVKNPQNLSEVFLSLLKILNDNLYTLGQASLALLDEYVFCYDLISKENKQNIAEFIVKLIPSNNWDLMSINNDNYERANDLLNINDIDFITNKMDNQGGNSKRPPSRILDTIDENRKAKRPISRILDNVDETRKSKRVKYIPNYDELDKQFKEYLANYDQEAQKLDKKIKFNSNERDKEIWDMIYSLFNKEKLSMHRLLKKGVPAQFLMEIHRYAMYDPRFYDLFFYEGGGCIDDAVMSNNSLRAFFCEYFDHEFKERFYNDIGTVPKNELESSFAVLELLKLKSYRIQHTKAFFFGVDPKVQQAITEHLELNRRCKSTGEHQTKRIVSIAQTTIINQCNKK